MTNNLMQTPDTTIRNYKDTVFRLLFNNKEKMLELYNALYDTNYPPGTPVDINTIANTYLVITEHQSTINHNMPLRDLWYIAEIYKTMVDRKAVYKETPIKLPRPTFVVMYNGTKSLPPESHLNLSDCFLGDGESLLNLSVMDEGSRLPAATPGGVWVGGVKNCDGIDTTIR